MITLLKVSKPFIAQKKGYFYTYKTRPGHIDLSYQGIDSKS
jgi:hypothetical protein